MSFNLDDIFALTLGDVQGVKEPVVKVEKPVAPSVKTVGPKPRALSCTACGGSGLFKGATYVRACFRCKPSYSATRGLGYITPEKEASNARYDEYVKRGTHAITHEVHEKKQGSNSFGYNGPTSFTGRRPKGAY